MNAKKTELFQGQSNEWKKWQIPLLVIGVTAFEIIFFTVAAFMINISPASSASTYMSGTNTVANGNRSYATPLHNRASSNSMANASNATANAANQFATPPTSSQSNLQKHSDDCGVGSTGTFAGGNFRSDPRHSVNQANIIAIVDPGATVKILSIATGEPRKTTGNTMWFKVKFQAGSCQYDNRNRTDVYSCGIQNLDTGYINADLISGCHR